MALARSSSLFWKLFLPIGLLLLASGVVASVFLPVVITSNAEREAVDAAQATVRQFLVLRKYYTENVAARVLAQSDMTVSFDYRDHPKAIPLPATMVHELSLLLQGSGTALKLYSPYPFPHRRDRAGDRFGDEAWAYLQKHPDGVFYRTESVDGRSTVRVALADRMSTQACVACHNALASSPKKDWKLGDVRGVLEVDSTREVASASRIVILVLSTLGVIMVATALFLRIFYQRNVAQPLHRALDSARALTAARSTHVAAVQAIADGKLEHAFVPAPLPDIDVSAVAHDEVGDLLQSVAGMGQVQRAFDDAFAKMTVSLRESRTLEQEQDWLKSSQNELNTVMRGEQELAVLGQRVLAFLVERVGACAGALYVHDEQSQQMQYLAGYGLASDAHPAAVVAGEGLAGQVLRSGRTIHLTDVPAGFLPVVSALGGADPASLLVLPLAHGGNMVGLLELGSFRRFSAAELALLAQVSEGIAIGFEVNIARERTRLLLAETEQQAEELRVQQEELQQSNAELEERADLLEQQREQIRAKNVEVEQASRDMWSKAEQLQRVSTYKSEFMANMSHELRTPLNSMLILSSLLRENKGSNLTAKQLEYAETIHGAGRDLLNLINDILDLAKIEAGKVEFHYEPTDMADICEAMQAQFHALAEQKGLQLYVACAPEVPSVVQLDGPRIQQVLKNLLSNAIKFTHHGEVALQVAMADTAASTLSGPALAFAVRDTGIGVAADKQAMIFEAFKQADGGISRSYGGTGLGLSISLQLARQMGGALRLASVPGQGSTFTLYMPLLPASQPAADAAEAPPAPVRPQQQTAPTPAPSPVQSPSAPRSILIIEDDMFFAQVLADFVQGRGYAPLLAGDGERGLELAQQHTPGAILLDVMMARMDGWEVMARLKDDPRTRHIPVHFISCLEEWQRAMDLGAVGFVTKPVSKEQLSTVFDTIEQAWAQSLKRVLVVEDDAGQLSSLAELLSGRDVDVVRAQTGGAALELLKREHFDCMVLDLGLSDMSGYDVLTQLQSTPELRNLPVVIHSGQDLTRDEQRKLNRYAKSIIIKGSRSPERLLGEVQLFLHSMEQQRSGAPLPDVGSLDGRKVLIVDDDMRNLFSLTSLLSERGVVVVEAENGGEALQRLDEHPDVSAVLMDIMMPQMDGYEAMRRIRADARWQQLPVIAMTAKAMPGDHQKCLEAGASDYLAKPIDTNQLLSLLRVWISR